MKKFLCLFVLIILAFYAKSQYVPMNAAGYQFKGVLADTLMFATGCGAPVTTPGLTYHRSAIYYDTCGSKGFYVYDPPTFTWNLIGSGDVSFPLFVDTIFSIDDSTFRWCKGSVCHDILIKGGDFISECNSINLTQLDSALNTLTWQRSLINSPDLTQDNFSHDHSKTFTWDSLLQMNIHILNWVDIIGDKDAGREDMLKMHVSDAGKSVMSFSNSTITDGAYSPLIAFYRDPRGVATDNGSGGVRALVDTLMDYAGATTPAFGFIAAVTHDADNPNAPPLFDLQYRPLYGFGNATFYSLLGLASGQIQLPKYVSGAFAGTAVNGLGVDASGNVIATGATGAETDAIALAKTITENDGYGLIETQTATQALSTNPSWTRRIDTFAISTREWRQKLADSLSSIVHSTDTVNVANADAWSVPHDGVTSANANANSMIANSTKRKFYFPAGVYILDVSALRSGSQTNKKGLEVSRDSIEIFGDPAGGTIFKAKATATGDTSTTNWYPVINGLYRSNVYIHDITVDGNKANEAIYNSNPFVNPSGHNDTSKHYNINGIYFKDGVNNRIEHVTVHDASGFGIEFYNAQNQIINYFTSSANGMAGLAYTTKSTGAFSNGTSTGNNSDNIRIDACTFGNIYGSYIEVSFSGTHADPPNWFAGIWHNNSSNLYFDHIYSHDNSAYGIDGSSDSTYKNINITNCLIEYNGNGAIAVGTSNTRILNNTFKNNGKKRDGTTDTHSNYNPGAIVVHSAPRLTISQNTAVDTGVGSQTYFIKNWAGGGSTGFYNSIVTDNHAYGNADTAHFQNGNNGTNSILSNHIYTLAGAWVAYASDTAILAMANGIEKWIPKWANASGGSAISALIAAAATNTIDNTVYKQEWQWNTLAGTDALKLSSTSTAAASNAQTLLNIALSGVNGTSAQTTKALSVSNTHTGTTSTNIGIYTTATGGATANWGLQADAPGVASTVTGGIQLLNSTASTSGATVQMAPTISLLSHAWKSNATAVDQTAEYYFQNLPTTGAAQIGSTFSLQFKRNGAAATTVFSVSDLGVWNFPVVSGNPTFQFGNGYTAMAGNSVTTAYGLSLGPAGTTGWLNLSGSFTTASTAMIGINNNPILSGASPGNSSPSYGIKSIPATNSSTNYTTVPTDFIGVSGNPQYATGATAVVFPKVTGVEGAVTLSAGINVNATLARAFHAWITGAANPTGKAVTWIGLDIDSADNNHYTTSNYGIKQVGTNAINFFAGSGIFGWNGGVNTASQLQTTSFSVGYKTTAVDYTATTTDNTIEVTVTGKTVTLPTAVGIQGRQYVIKLTASGSGTVATTSSQNIDASTTYSLSAQYKYVTVESNGANWIVVANN